MFRKIGAFIAVLLLGILLVACGNDTKTITFEVNGGTNLDTVEFAESYKFTDLDKLVTMKPGYTLDGWYTTSTLDEASKVTSDLTKSVTLYAKWLIVEYTITYHLDGGTNAVNNPAKFTILDEVTLESPIKESYVFSGWYLESNFKTNVEKIEKGITQNIDVYAKWQSESVETVKVTWKNFDGTVLKVDENVEKGSLPVFTGQTPTKPSTAEFSFTFNGWSPEVIHATADVEYTATFSETKNKYTVTWKNHDGTTLLVSQDVLFGTTPSYTGTTPTKAETQTHTYTFKGWSPTISEVTGNVTYMAVFEEVAKTSGVGQELNIIFGFDIYALMPSLAKGNVEVTESSDDDWIGAYIDLYGWSEADVTNYESQLIQKGFEYDADFEMYFFNDEIVLYFDFDDDLNVYYIDIYMERTDGGSGEIDAIGQELNDFFGFDIYALIPKIESNQFELSDSSEEGYFGSYVDLYDWTESNINAYTSQLLDLGFVYDEAYDTYYTELIYIYFAFDEDLNTYYMDIYMIDEGGIVDPTDIGEALNDFFGFNIYATIPAILSDDFELMDSSFDVFFGSYVFLYDWDAADVESYKTQLLDMGFVYDFEYDDYSKNEYYIYFDFDDELNSYYIDIYTIDEGGVTPSDIGGYLNEYFQFDIYSTIPAIESLDFVFTEITDQGYMGQYIDLYDWVEADVDAFIQQLASFGFIYDSEYDEYFNDSDIFIFIDFDENINAFYIAIYTYDNGDIEPTEIGDYLNDFFGFDIYSLIPDIISNDYYLSDSSEDEYVGTYIDLFDWEQADVDQYETLLVSNGFVREESENGHYFVYDDKIYIYFDIYEDAFYMDIYMHMDDLDDGGNGGEDEEGLFYEFNVQNTTTSLTNSYKNTVNAELKFAGQNPNIAITASHVANSSTPPTGLGAYTHIFAADVKDYPNPVTYLEVKTTGQLISSIRFEIHGSSDVTTNITSAKVQVWNGSAWVDLAGSEFKNQISTSLNVITIENINSSQFRLLFTGKGDNKNSGRFAIGNVELYASSAFQILSWDDLITYFSNKFNLSNLNVLLPRIDEVTDFETNMIGSNYYEVMLARQTIDVDAFMEEYDEALLSLNWVFENGEYVYALSENHALTLDIKVDGELILFTIRKHLLNVPEAEFDTLSNMQTVNDLQKSLGDASGLPSMGTFDVLVIPVEINGVPFDMDYLDKLELVFNGKSEETGWESVSSFYAKSSFGLLNLSFDIVDKIETNNGKTYFEDKKDTWDENNGDGYAIKEVLTKADPNIDFSKYDVNDDEYIDSIIFVYSVDYRTESSDLWWAWVYLASQGDAKDIELDGLTFEYYMWVSYSFLEDPLSGEDLPANAETYIHELGHLLGLPDLYPYETSGNGPLGGWDMMDNNNGDHGPFNKLILGWLNPLIGEQGTYRVKLDSYSTDLDGKDSVIIIPRSSNAFNDGNAWDEFIMIMFYTPEGLYEGHMNDRFKIRNAGVVIYHVDARLANNPDFWTYFMQDNEGKTNLLVGLLEADKNNSIPGNTSVSQSDILTSGGIDLSTYKWNQGGSINVTIDIESDISNTSSNVSLILNIA